MAPRMQPVNYPAKLVDRKVKLSPRELHAYVVTLDDLRIRMVAIFLLRHIDARATAAAVWHLAASRQLQSPAASRQLRAASRELLSSSEISFRVH